METGQPTLKDDSRPAFPRPKCCLGIYLDALEAVSDKETLVGSQHAFMMTVMDRMLSHLQTLDLAKIKGALERRHICDGVILEGFTSGCVLAVTFDSLEAVEGLWTLHSANRLTPVCQDILVDKALLRATNTVKLMLRAKLWMDEYKSCKEEIVVRSPNRRPLGDFENDLGMVKRVKAHQKTMPEVICRAKDEESKFEHRLGEFMLTVKRALPDTTTVVRNLNEFIRDIKLARGVKKIDFESLDQYLLTLDFFKRVFTEIEDNIIHPLCQVRAICEKDKQRKLKKTIKDDCSGMLAKLQPDSDLQKIRHKEWELKVLPREHGLLYGLISLVPMCLDKLTTIDLMTDEYIMDFPEMAA